MTLRIVLGLTVCLCLWAGDKDSTAALDKEVRRKIAGFQGKVSIYAKNLDSGEAYGLDAELPVRTASTIKLPIMVECFAESTEGKLDFNERIKITAEEKVSGSGIAQDLSDDVALPVRDLITLMIVLSDNTATNLIINRISDNVVNARMEKLGLTQTRAMRKILGDGNKLKPYPSGISDEGAKPENKKWGIGRSCPREMVMLLEKLYRGELVSKSASDGMIEILKKQRDHSSIGRDMKDVTIANKSGALDALRSDVGVVYTKHGAIAMAITVDGMPEPDWSPDNAGEKLISSLSETLAEGLASNH